MKRLILSFMITLSLVLGVGNVVPVAYAASPTDAAKGAVCQGISGQVGSGCAAGGADIKKAITLILNILSIIAGVVAVFMIIISGFKYITSSGDSNAVGSAKRTLIYAIVGLVVVAMSQIIVKFVVAQLNK